MWALLITLQALVTALTGMYIEYKAHAGRRSRRGAAQSPVCTGSLFGAVRAVCAFFGISQWARSIADVRAAACVHRLVLWVDRRGARVL